MTTQLPFPSLRQEELHQPFRPEEAQFEAERCLYCADAPCMQACPTHIDIPGFIKKIDTGNVTGSAKTILQANFLGGTCARVCPVEELCEGACVLNKTERPISIGRLQRYATDYSAHKDEALLKAGTPTGKKVLVVGSGPAGLSAAATLAQSGHFVEVWERREMAGGLSTYGIITLREPIEVALHEVKMVEQLGVKVSTNTSLETQEELVRVASEFDAVYLGTGLGKVPGLDFPGADKAVDGLEFIAQFKTAPDSLIPPRRVVVIGAGNTAIDAATTARQCGAQATIIYRRTPGEMTAFDAEYEFATNFGIEFQFLAAPAEILLDEDGEVSGIRGTRMEVDGVDAAGRKRVVPSGEPDVIIPCDMVISAIGQEKYEEENSFGLGLNRGFLDVESFKATGQFENVFAGGDAIRVTGDASTVMAVQDGKLAARAINDYLEGK
ncbi:NAD(P)-dependent oxidoreductase [Corynebacterium flavescens]|uniref:NAD(P)-dependent oxidoreductase n=1 Tax=Corynebacterium flavescens TaxID=28028 RepID=UPI002648EF0C|nr:NAD(P)-dependent oxidoreductase [Corynebacterium flavescens]MDN6099027.1 NAD(P)-dependent oxidoreductase [Corynebacterium flavescens]MDN6198797.1 NAD(P)-dependent oxidoreductase [Corynebacterium flavescens]MDN6226302.1 NAD(P)-dependent oxidoreductase [Corynebacterium flavescens]MDN6235245.1 NAD(P)-dependent oxidoreductase [Corynebacterium flavescens]MDN6431686.1 NAD(P)-dependent oxidoreductase [Corynebacterium flavescens]